MLTHLNNILDNINYLSSSQLNTAVATVVYKQRQKPVHHHKSHRLVRVSPLIGRLIGEYLRPAHIAMSKLNPNQNQSGYTEGVNFLLAALQRHETEMFCLDNKKTFFSCSLDGVSAFDIVNRQIQLRELYFAGDTGKHWQANYFEYNNSKTKIKMNNKLSSELEETLGCKQGSIKSGDHWKIYISTLLETMDSANLGVSIGPINVGVSCCADDVLAMSDDQHKLQCLLDIASKTGGMFKIQYGASKTKIIVSGPEIDQGYYADTKPWVMDNQTVSVVEDNDHLGQIISGQREY